MASKKPKNNISPALRSEQAMIEGIVEGSPDAVGVAVVRLDCGCRKMAALDSKGDPASKIIVYRDGAQSVCDLCRKDNGGANRVEKAFIHWLADAPLETERRQIEAKVLGSGPQS